MAWVQECEEGPCMGGIRDSRGPVEGAEEGHEKSSIVSEGASSDVVHW